MNDSTIKLKLVDDTMGAAYLDKEINFKLDSLAWWQDHTNRKAFSDTKYPDITSFCFKGSDLVFRARTDDFFKATR